MMRKENSPKSFVNILSTSSGFLSKMEIVLIFVLSITSGYAIKMEMLLAETKPLSSPMVLVNNTEKQHDNGNQFNAMSQNDLPKIHNNILNFISRIETTDQNYANITDILRYERVRFDAEEINEEIDIARLSTPF
jgi:hypothetical protein